MVKPFQGEDELGLIVRLRGGLKNICVSNLYTWLFSVVPCIGTKFTWRGSKEPRVMTLTDTFTLNMDMGIVIGWIVDGRWPHHFHVNKHSEYGLWHVNVTLG